jgi:hypothetical protein
VEALRHYRRRWVSGNPLGVSVAVVVDVPRHHANGAVGDVSGTVSGSVTGSAPGGAAPVRRASVGSCPCASTFERYQ